MTGSLLLAVAKRLILFFMLKKIKITEDWTLMGNLKLLSQTNMMEFKFIEKILSPAVD